MKPGESLLSTIAFESVLLYTLREQDDVITMYVVTILSYCKHCR